MDVNAGDHLDDITALSWAAGSNPSPEIIAILIKSGANINAKSKNGSTALMRAASSNPNPEIITTLIKSGANPKVGDRNYRCKR